MISLILFICGIVIGILAAMLFESSQAVFYMHKLQELNKLYKDLTNYANSLFEENSKLQTKLYQYEVLLRSHKLLTDENIDMNITEVESEVVDSEMD